MQSSRLHVCGEDAIWKIASFRMKIVRLGERSLKGIIIEVKNFLERGKVLILPTDTVYGLVCDARNKWAVEKIFAIKKRAKDKPIGIFVRDLEMAKRLAEIPEKYEKFLESHSDLRGKITIVVKKKKNLPAGNENTIGIRIPDYALIHLLFKRIDFPLAQTSANMSGNPASTKIKELIAQFEKQKTQPDLVVDAGDLVAAKPSTVINLTENPQVLRKGELTPELTQELIQELIQEF